MTPITPLAIGRIVHYYQELPAGRRDDVQPNAAIITRINGDGTVNLSVFHSGMSSSPSGNAQSVRFGDPEQDKTGRLWCWPPPVGMVPRGTAAPTPVPLTPEEATAIHDAQDGTTVPVGSIADRAEAAMAGSADRDGGEPPAEAPTEGPAST